jgi:hypothetical protein
LEFLWSLEVGVWNFSQDIDLYFTLDSGAGVAGVGDQEQDSVLLGVLKFAMAGEHRRPR